MAVAKYFLSPFIFPLFHVFYTLLANFAFSMTPIQPSGCFSIYKRTDHAFKRTGDSQETKKGRTDADGYKPLPCSAFPC